MTIKKTLAISVLLILCNNIFAQKLQEGELRWSSTRRLTESDYAIKVSSLKNTPIYSQFMIRHQIGGFDFLKKNLNQKIENVFFQNASWIENTGNYNTSELLAYQQIQFDMAEIMTRKFRKKVIENKSEISKGVDFVNKTSQEMMTEFSNRRLLLEKETEGGLNKNELKKWEEQVASELLALEEFSFENKDKIKIVK